MSSGAKQVLYIGEETTRNVPATTFEVARFTDTSMDATVQKSESTSITDSRLSEGSFVTGVEYAGDANFELHKSTLIEKLMAGVAFNEWAGDALTVGGNNRKTFTLVRGYNDTTIQNFQQFTGCHVSGMTLDVPIDGVLNIGFSFMGMGRKKLSAKPVASPAQSTPFFTSVTVGEILVDGISTLGDSCITAFNLTIDNAMQIQKCLGGGLKVGAIIETSATISGSFTTAWSTRSAEWYEQQFKNKPISIKIPIRDAIVEELSIGDTYNEYLVTIPVGEISAPLPSGAKGDILSTDFAYNAVRSPITITRSVVTIEE